MKDLEYKIEVDNLNKVINIAIDVIKNNPPKGFSPENINHFLNTYLDFKNAINKPSPEHRNKKSLKYHINDVFTFFQESHGEAVNLFWDNIKKNNLPYKRENKLLKILKRKKINNDVEYNFIIDVINPYKSDGLINDEDINLINLLLNDYQKKTKRL